MTFIIAEAGINHNGDLKLAKDLVDSAVSSGANAVKFQTFWNIGRLEKYEFSFRDWISLINYCEHRHIYFMSTPHCFQAIDFLDEYVSIHKIASPYISDPLFVKLVASKNKPMLISTGNIKNYNKMASNKSIRECIGYIGDDRIKHVVLLHCVSEYPCEDGHYERIDQIKRLTGIAVGLSDHTKNIELPKGLPVYEKHIMLEDIDCVDKCVSLTPNEFKEMVKWLR